MAPSQDVKASSRNRKGDPSGKVAPNQDEGNGNERAVEMCHAVKRCMASVQTGQDILDEVERSNKESSRNGKECSQ